MADTNNCVSFYETDSSLTARPATKQLIEEGYEPVPVTETETVPAINTAVPTITVKKKSKLWIWAAVAVTALLLAPTNKNAEVEP